LAFGVAGVSLTLPGFDRPVAFHNWNRGTARRRCNNAADRRNNFFSSAGCHPRHRQTGSEIPVGFDDRDTTRHGMGLPESFFE
jgi:hypothetical protein